MLQGANCFKKDGKKVGTFFRIEGTGEAVVVKLKGRFKWSDPEGLLALDPQFVDTKQGSISSKRVRSDGDGIVGFVTGRNNRTNLVVIYKNGCAPVHISNKGEIGEPDRSSTIPKSDELMFLAVNQISGPNSWQNNGVNVEYTGTINKDDQQIQCALNGFDVYPGCVPSKKRSKSSTGQKKKPRGGKNNKFKGWPSQYIPDSKTIQNYYKCENLKSDFTREDTPPPRCFVNIVSN